MIRPFQPEDLPRLQEIRAANGFDCELWDYAASDTINADVFEDETGCVVGFMASRAIAETFYLADPAWQTPGQRAAMFSGLYHCTERKMAARGILEAVAWLQAKVARPFGRRLRKHWGWREVKSAAHLGQVRVY